MDITTQRDLSIKLFIEPSLKLDLATFSEVGGGNDITHICAFLEGYSTRYKIDVFTTDVSNALVEKKHAFTSSLMTEILSLSAADFERISAIVCKCLGYPEYYGTKGSHDEGVDFIAHSDYDRLKIGFKNHVLGQCKHFANNLVGTEDIRALAGSAILFTRKEFSSYNDKYKRFNLNAFSHLNVYFITSYFYSADSIRLCRNTDIINLDIIDVCCLCVQGVMEGKLNWVDAAGNLVKANLMHDLSQVEIVN